LKLLADGAVQEILHDSLPIGMKMLRCQIALPRGLPRLLGQQIRE
jgi:hypothetical protein